MRQRTTFFRPARDIVECVEVWIPTLDARNVCAKISELCNKEEVNLSLSTQGMEDMVAKGRVGRHVGGISRHGQHIARHLKSDARNLSSHPGWDPCSLPGLQTSGVKCLSWWVALVVGVWNKLKWARFKAVMDQEVRRGLLTGPRRPLRIPARKVPHRKGRGKERQVRTFV